MGSTGCPLAADRACALGLSPCPRRRFGVSIRVRSSARVVSPLTNAPRSRGIDTSQPGASHPATPGSAATDRAPARRVGPPTAEPPRGPSRRHPAGSRHPATRADLAPPPRGPRRRPGWPASPRSPARCEPRQVPARWTARATSVAKLAVLGCSRPYPAHHLHRLRNSGKAVSRSPAAAVASPSSSSTAATCSCWSPCRRRTASSSSQQPAAPNGLPGVLRRRVGAETPTSPDGQGRNPPPWRPRSAPARLRQLQLAAAHQEVHHLLHACGQLWMLGAQMRCVEIQYPLQCRLRSRTVALINEDGE